ncbi:MAG: hypothetical protein ACOX56_06215 [Acholeplasmataceae bacterium]|jgi:hypothetical protein
MKINKRLYDSLTREPNEVQLIGDKKLEIFFMTEEEKQMFEADGRYNMWTSDGKNFRFLVNEEFYNYGVIKEFYKQPINAMWINYIDRISKYQRKFLYTLMLPLMVVYLIVAVLAITLLPDYAIYILIGMMVVIFAVNAVQSKVVRKKMDEENDKTQNEIQEHLTPEVYEQVANDQVQFREMKNKERELAYEKEQQELNKTEEVPPEDDVVDEVETEEENKKEDSHA